MRENMQFAEGIIRIRRIPDSWSESEYREWWLPTTDNRGQIIRPARISEREKQAMQIGEFHNAIMNAGRTQILTYMGSLTGSSVPWGQYFAIGTGAITATSPTDTALSNEIFRKQPTSYSVNGTEVDLNIQLAATDAEATFTNAGIFGNSATSTLGSGSLLTHALFSFTKGNFAISVDYVVNLL